MNKTALTLTTILYLSACGQSIDANKKQAVPAQTPAQPTAQTQPEVKQLTAAEAHDFAKWLLKRISDEELYLKDAIALKEVNTVEKIHQDLTRPADWPAGDAADPYTKCDTARIDLGILANAQLMNLKSPSATMQKIVRQETEDYQKSKGLCEVRVKMTAEQAVKAESMQ